MKQLITTIAAVLVVGCGESQQSPEPPTAKAPDISIHIAAMQGNLEAVKQHIAAGTDVNAKDRDDWPPLLKAAWHGHKEIAELLIDEGAEVNAKANDGGTPLYFAAMQGHRETAELLIANGADVNAKEIDGWTPLHIAANRGQKETAELLIGKGANVNAKNAGGKTPLDIANHPENPNDVTETINLLRKHGGKTGEELKAEEK